MDHDDDDLRQRVEAVCAELDLDHFAANTVEAWIRRDPSTWPTCCLGGCDPCNGVLRRAALRVIDELRGPRKPG